MFKINDKLKQYIDENEEKVKKGGINFSGLEYYGRLLLLDFFNKNGFFILPDEKVEIPTIKNKIKLISGYDRHFSILLGIMEKEGYIKINGETIITTGKVKSQKVIDDLSDSGGYKNRMIVDFPDMKIHFNLLDICLSQYNKILCGEKSPDAVMFPVFSTELVEGVFRDNMLSDYFNILVADTVSSYIEHLKKNGDDSVIKVLEVGAGTGGTSVFVTEKIRNFTGIEFYFTDISKVFVRNFEKKNKEKYPFLVCKKMNIEEEPSVQGFEKNSFDIIIASNVLHSTKNIDNTLANIKFLKKDGGIFLLNEVTKNQDFTSLTFGLLGGWWLFTDPEIRIPNSPLLDINSWKTVLEKSGFENINMVSSSDLDTPDSFSQTLFMIE